MDSAPDRRFSVSSAPDRAALEWAHPTPESKARVVVLIGAVDLVGHVKCVLERDAEGIERVLRLGARCSGMLTASTGSPGVNLAVSCVD